MKICFLINRIDRSGGKRVLLALSQGLAKNGHEVVWSVRPGEPPFRDPLGLVKVQTLQLPPLFRWIIPTPIAYLCFFFIPKHTDAVVATFYPTAFVAWLRCLGRKKTRAFYFVQMLEGYFSGGIRIPLAWLTYQLPIVRIANSHWMELELRRRTINANLKRIQLGMDLNLFNGNIRSINQNEVLTVGTIGRNLAVKGLAVFWEYLRHHRRHRKILAKVMSTENIEVPLDLQDCVEVFSGNNDTEVVSFYRSLDLFISTSFQESFAYPALEAMACATATVTTDNGGCAEYAKNEINCIIVKPGDFKSILNAAERIIIDPNLHRKLVESGLDTASHFSWDQSCEQFENILAENV